MNDMERQKFEDSFQEAFKGAEASPSENVWTNIELDLEKAEGDKMKRRIFFFKMLAAASIAFALCVSGIGYYILSDKEQYGNIAQTDSNVDLSDPKENLNSSAVIDDKNKQADATVKSNSQEGVTKGAAEPQKKDERIQQKNIVSEGNTRTQELKGQSNNNPISDDQTNPKLNSFDAKNDVRLEAYNAKSEFQQDDPTGKDASPLAAEDNGVDDNKNGDLRTSKVAERVAEMNRELPAFYQPKQPELRLQDSKADPGALLLAKLADEELRFEKEDKRKEKTNSEKLWTSVGFAAGGFNALNTSVSNNFYSITANNTASKQSEASGVAYSVGVSVGTKLSKRWILQGGFNYLTQSSDYTANNVVVDNNLQSPQAESLNVFSKAQMADASETKVAPTFPYTVNNNVQFVSMPLQAGYLIVNKKFGLQVNAGISTDLFLQNTITPEGGGGLSRTTQGRGEDSPYRSLNFSGLMGTELSYKLGFRYRVSLNPGLRYPLNSVYKSNTGVSATPLTFDVGLRFRYIFH